MTTQAASIEPIGEELQANVIAATREWIQLARDLYQHPFADIPVLFNLRGLSAGMYSVKGRERLIRYNPHHFAKYFQLNLTETVPHEVAHYIADILYGLNRIRPHGEEWQAIMRRFGVEPKVSCDYDMTGIPVRQTRTHTYYCTCNTHQLSSYRHKRIQQGKARYYCLSCKGELAQHHQLPLNL